VVAQVLAATPRFLKGLTARRWKPVEAGMEPIAILAGAYVSGGSMRHIDRHKAFEHISGKGKEVAPGITLYGEATNVEITRFMYAEPKKGEDFKLYLLLDGSHKGAHWFTSGKIRYPEEQMAAKAALILAQAWILTGQEVRVTDDGDMLVFHSKDGKVLHPAGVTIEEFWALL